MRRRLLTRELKDRRVIHRQKSPVGGNSVEFDCLPVSVVSVIFDMDGVLVDSEPLWWQAGVAELGSVGVVLGNDRSHQTRGMRTDDAFG